MTLFTFGPAPEDSTGISSTAQPAAQPTTTITPTATPSTQSLSWWQQILKFLGLI